MPPEWRVGGARAGKKDTSLHECYASVQRKVVSKADGCPANAAGSGKDLAKGMAGEVFGMMEKRVVRQAVPQDSAELARLAAQMWDHAEQGLEEEFRELTQDPRAAVFILDIDGEAAGFAQCQLRSDYVEGTHTSPVGYLEGIFISEKYRKRGCAKALLAKGEEWAAAQGCTEFASDCELDNDASLAFHLAMGFEEANRVICFTKAL